MPDFDFGIYRLANIGGTNGFQFGGTVTLRDDYSRYIIAWKVCTTMKANDVTDHWT